MEDGTNHAMFNLITYNSPLVPAIMSEISMGSNATVAAAYGPTSFVVDHLERFDIVLKNGDAGKHPLYVLLFFTLFSLSLSRALSTGGNLGKKREANVGLYTATCTGTRCSSSGARRTTRPTTRR